MFETAGAPTIVEPAGSIVWLVLLPLLGAIGAAISALGATPRDRLAARIAIAVHGGWLALAVAVGVRLALMPPGRMLTQHVAQLARLGQLDLTLDLALDPASAALTVLVAFVALASVLHATWSCDEGLTSRLGWTSLLAAGVTLVVVADTWPFIVIGLELAVLGSWGLARGGSARRLGVALAGDASIAVAAGVLFWSLGGSFSAAGYTPDAQPRYALVAVTNQSAPAGKSTLTLSSYAGALVVADDGPPLPNEPLRAPFTVVLDPGTYSFRIQAGVASSDNVVSHVALSAGHAYVLVPYGPTASLRALGDELVVPRPASLGQGSARAVLASRAILGVRVTTLVTLLVALGALLRLGLLARTGAPPVAFALEAIPVVVVVMRVAPLVDTAWPSSTALATAAAAVAVVCAADAAGAREHQRGARASLAAIAATAVAAVLAGDVAGALTITVASVLAASAATCAAAGDGDVRWLGVACAAMTGLLPGAGVSAGQASAMAAEVASGRGVPAASLTAAALALVALALFRVYGARIETGRTTGGHAGPRVVVATLAIGSLAAGAALGVATTPFGGHAAPLARRLVGTTSLAIDNAPRLFVGTIGATILAAAFGLLVARRSSDAEGPPRWLAVLELPGRLAARGAAALGALARRVEGAVASMDEHVLDDVASVVAQAAIRAGALLRRGESLGSSAVWEKTVDRAGVAVLAKVGLDDPRVQDRVRTAVVLVMVALLGLVVLSSVLLG
jgi:hypothetical protein